MLYIKKNVYQNRNILYIPLITLYFMYFILDNSHEISLLF